jgi:hypothetical protein
VLDNNRHRRTAACLTAAWLLVMTLVTYMLIDPLKYPLAAALRQPGGVAGMSGLVRLVLDQLSPGMLAAPVAAGVLGLAVIVTEWRTAGLSQAITAPVGWIVFLAALFWFGHAYLVPGHLLMGDLGNHIAMVALRMQAVLGGHDPYWNNFQYLGQPLPEFYAPTTFWPATLIALAFHDPTLGTKLFLLLAHFGSGLAAYALARAYGLRRASAWLAGLIYAGSFAHLHLILYRGTVPNALSAALLPLAFLFLHRTLVQEGWLPRVAFWLAAAAAGLLMNYVPFGVVAGLFMAAYAGVMLLSRAAAWRRLVPLAGAGLAAGALAAWVLLPAMLASRGNAAISSDRLLYLSLPNGEMLNHLLVWRAWRTNYGHDSSAYLGLVALILAGIGLWSVSRRTGAPAQRWPAWAMALLFLFSLTVHGDFLRSIILTLLPLAILAGMGADAVLARFAAYRSAPALLAGLLLLDMGPAAIQPLARTDLGTIDTAGEYLAQQRPGGRTLEGTSETGRFKASQGGDAGIQQLYPAEFVVGGYTQLAGPAQDAATLAAGLVESDLGSHQSLGPDTTSLLCQLRVRRIDAVNRTSMGLPPDIPGPDDGPLGRVVKPNCPFDIVFAATTESADPLRTDDRATLAQFMARMNLNGSSGVAGHILAPGPDRASTGGASSGAGPTVSDYQVTSDRVRIALASDGPGFVRLPQGWYRQQVVTRNGQPVQSFPDAMGLMVVPIEAGPSVIEVSPGVTEGQTAGRLVSLAALLLLLAAAFAVRLRRRRPA